MEQWRLFLIYLGSNLEMHRNGTVGCTGLQPNGSRPEAVARDLPTAAELMYIADSLEEQDMERTNEPSASSAGPPHVSATAAGGSSGPLTGRATARGDADASQARKESDTIEDMLAEEIYIQEERERELQQKRKRVQEEIEKHDLEVQEEQRREVEEDEQRWQQHLASQLQAEEDELLAQELQGRQRRKRITLNVIMRSSDGTAVSEGQHVAVVAAGDRVSVQFSFAPETAVVEHEHLPEETHEEQNEEMQHEQEATDEEILSLAAVEFPESAFWKPDRLWRSWFALWKAGIVKDDQVERRWQLQGLLDFQTELAQQLVQARASQVADTLMSQSEAVEESLAAGAAAAEQAGHMAAPVEGQMTVSVDLAVEAPFPAPLGSEDAAAAARRCSMLNIKQGWIRDKLHSLLHVVTESWMGGHQG